MSEPAVKNSLSQAPKAAMGQQTASIQIYSYYELIHTPEFQYLEIELQDKGWKGGAKVFRYLKGMKQYCLKYLAINMPQSCISPGNKNKVLVISAKAWREAQRKEQKGHIL